MREFFNNKRILVTGACGTVGNKLVQQLLEERKVGELIGLDNNESELFFLEQRFSKYKNARFTLGDVRDLEKLIQLNKNIDVIFHAAAFKHVSLCERSPFEAVQTNIIGVQNIISAACEKNVERVIFTSSDKAVNPTNVMGTTKLMGERLMTAANGNLHGSNTIFASTRFGNVLGSRGSVIPIFKEQIKHGGPVTLTDPDMTRFIMSIAEAVRLVIDSAVIARGGEVLITKMPVIRIKDLAMVMIRELAPQYGINPEDVQIEVIGTKPGEKMYEELMSDEETRRAIELPYYFSVLPALTSLYRPVEYNYPEIVSQNVAKVYHSGHEAPLTQVELTSFLAENRLLEETIKDDHPRERHWP